MKYLIYFIFAALSACTVNETCDEEVIKTCDNETGECYTYLQHSSPECEDKSYQFGY